MEDLKFSVIQEVIKSVCVIECEVIISLSVEIDMESGSEYLVFTFKNCLDPWLAIDKLAHIRAKARNEGLKIVFLPGNKREI
jgi:hypothetical protein